MHPKLAHALCSLFLAAAASADTDKPNIVVLLTDDQAAWAVGAYGNRDIHTPNIDRLAREGVLFTQAFTPTPVCSPSRVAFFTGRYGSEVGIHDWLHPQREPHKGLPPGIPTWPELLRRAGYRTALFGKWHLGLEAAFHPTRRGFDEFVGFLAGGNRPMNPTLEVHGRPQRLQGPLPDLLADYAIRFIEANASRPFVVCVCFRAPHAPYGPVPAADRKPYATVDPALPGYPGLDLNVVRQRTLAYYASITSVDRNVGRIVHAIDRLGLGTRTVVLFTSDHGYNIGHHGLMYKGNAFWLVPGRTRSRRPNMFDTSIRVPFIVRWSEKLQPGKRVDRVISFIDLFRTFADLAGVRIPDRYVVHGRSFRPLLEGRPGQWEDTLYGEYDMLHGAVARMRMIRTPRWKLVLHREDRQLDELYDLQNDPDERHNLATDPATRQIREELMRALTEAESRLRVYLP